MQAGTAVVRDALHALLVHTEMLEVAFAQPACDPAPLSRVERRPEDQRRSGLEQILEDLRRHSRRGPRRHIARRDHTGVAETGGECHVRLTLDHRDLAAENAQIEGGGHTDYPAA